MTERDIAGEILEGIREIKAYQRGKVHGLQTRQLISYPKIGDVRALPKHRLLVTFQNGVVKEYDCTPLLEQEVFSSLRDETLFAKVAVGSDGYGIVWNEEIDLSESELWVNGVGQDEHERK